MKLDSYDGSVMHDITTSKVVASSIKQHFNILRIITNLMKNLKQIECKYYEIATKPVFLFFSSSFNIRLLFTTLEMKLDSYDFFFFRSCAFIVFWMTYGQIQLNCIYIYEFVLKVQIFLDFGVFTHSENGLKLHFWNKGWHVFSGIPKTLYYELYYEPYILLSFILR